MVDLSEIGKRARSSARILSITPTEQRNNVLRDIGQLLLEKQTNILAANEKDVENARQQGLSDAMIDRLLITPSRLEGIVADIQRVIDLPDPLKEILDEQVLPNGLQVRKLRVPIGVLGVIYESRPNVTIDVSCLALKSGNAVILRGGSETIESNRALVEIIQMALQKQGLPSQVVQLIESPERRYVLDLLKMPSYVDLIIPRGGAKLHQFCRENSQIPVIVGGIGICHLFVDESADVEKSVEVIFNAKVQRPTVCNALDTLLVHRGIARTILPKVFEQLSNAGVTFRLDQSVLKLLNLQPSRVYQVAGEGDFDTEWLSLVLGVKIVDNIDEAIEHIEQHSTAHSDGILSTSPENIEMFIQRVDSAAVYVNASTRFTDGGQLGLGAEVAVSTQKIHARGPMGLKELTSYKWVIVGDGHVRR
ncbi:glutamate-5-semialdehyde dehydrogenase [Bellilinea caldifistulae]|uniref:Gamma-glutamyl phosphate reductase n=1 Tax=Bellilinea caldifistulae TaxID=360411 RepID=A0A0P6XS67_9CHLR|nr:glutamate-5-semialdehyde dehydrogenase [Bellilinea caldifistulae]KPL78053.1 gamma-glutamyl phosphate reductase [Bellilinea caldifistulae]GAP10747.1 glutamate-5-semialdehyde dehydrogenase [Bellilinea caldifistulae]